MVDDSGSQSPSTSDANANIDSNTDAAVPLEEIPLHSTNLLTVLDADGAIAYESPSIERIYGYDQDALVGDAVRDYFHPDDRERVVDAFRRVVESDIHTVEPVEYRHLRADGSYTWVESVASADPTPEGYYVVNTRDVSERRQREQNRKRTNERLAEFASVVAHDLRNPLSVAQGYLELAEAEAPSDHHESIEDALARMEKLVSGLLTDTRDGDRTTEVETIDLADLGETCWNNVATADATLTIETNRSIRADRLRFQQLLENLYRNAVEHGDHDVSVTLGSLQSGFYIEDEGEGIPPEERNRVFDPGYSTASEGTGFGLHIVQRVADAHRWSLRVVDGTTGGARFEITDVEFVSE
ncbi:sensor histidine kinase [Halobellus salinisoli]|uniref:sensor histidine kinase n=1 Tax=Halobellus salinisoli TaxID=3108500 RepID=UPI00300A1FF3